MPDLTTIVHTGDLQAALTNAAAGETIQFDGIEPAFVDIPKPLTLVGFAGAALNGGVHLGVPDVKLAGLTMRHPDPTQEILILEGDRARILNCAVLGDPVKGQHRGIRVAAAGCVLKRTVVDDCFLPDQDTQALCGWDGVQDLLAEDCFFRAGTEAVMFGGADPSSPSRIPRQVVLRRCTLTKRPEWRTMAVQVKNALELKNIVGLLVEACTIEYSWQQAQAGFLLVITPRNQGGTAPYSVVSDVTVQNSLFRHGSAAIDFLGTDNEQPSQLLTRVSVVNNRFEDIDPVAYGGENKLIEIGTPIDSLTIDRNVFVGQNLGSQVYFYGSTTPTVKATNLTITNNQWPTSLYGVFGGGSQAGLGPDGLPFAWHDYVASGVLSGNVAA